MNIDEILELQEQLDTQKEKLSKLFGCESFSPSQNALCPWKIGGNYLIRTVTHIQTGRLVLASEKELVLEDAAWIADTGRFSDSLKSCEFNEVEPFPEGQVIVGRGAVIDAVLVADLPRKKK